MTGLFLWLWRSLPEFGVQIVAFDPAMAKHAQAECSAFGQGHNRASFNMGDLYSNLPAVAAAASFVPVKLGEPELPLTGAESSCIEIQMRRGVTAVQLRWPLSAASGCADWLRAWLA